MNHKHIGAILLIIGILLTLFVFLARAKENQYISLLTEEQGTCFLENGTCLHEEKNTGLFITGLVLALLLIILSLYLLFFDTSQHKIITHQEHITKTLKEIKQDDTFNAFVAGFTTDEQTILKVVREQDGIKQSTLRFKTGLSKTMISLLLKSLEERDIIAKKPSGKTNQIFLRKKF